ncbi:MAG TPA: hypothetical protein VKT83_02535 [bacterium]|nr:hypothetical protein [bacterium]
MAQEHESYWALIEVERQLRNALSQVREAERLSATPNTVRTDISKIAEDLADAVSLAAATRRRLLEADRATLRAA